MVQFNLIEMDIGLPCVSMCYVIYGCTWIYMAIYIWFSFKNMRNKNCVL